MSSIDALYKLGRDNSVSCHARSFKWVDIMAAFYHTHLPTSLSYLALSPMVQYNKIVIVSSWIFLEWLLIPEVMSMQKVKVREQRSRSQRSWAHLAVSGPLLQFEFTYGDEMMHTAWCCLGEVPYCFWRLSVKFQGHTAKTIVDFDPNSAFPYRNFSLNSPMAMEWCTNLEAT